MPTQCFGPANLMHLHTLQPMHRVSSFISSCRSPSRQSWWPANCSTTGATGGSPIWVHDPQYRVYSIARQLSGDVQADEDFLRDNSATHGSTLKETPCINKTKFFSPVELPTDPAGCVCFILPYKTNTVMSKRPVT